MGVVLYAGILLAVTLGGLALHGLWLWVGCRAARIPGVSYARALLTAVVVSILGVGVTLAGLALTGPLQLALLLLGLLIPVMAVGIVGRAPLGRTLLAWVIWQGLGLAYTVLAVVGIRAALTEAFVVPTGAMAETVLGYHKTVRCPQCGCQFPVNANSEADPSQSPRRVTGCTCPNCRFLCDLDAGVLPIESGDRLLASKGLMSVALRPARFDLIVFTYPGDELHPQGAPGSGPPLRYVKRLVGLPGETVGIHYGKLYVRTGAGPTPEDRGAAPESLHLHRYMHEDECRELLEHPGQGEPGKAPFQILRKSPEAVLALRRLVYDNDHQASDLSDLPRWTAEPGAGWTADQARGFRCDGKDAAGTAWLHYRHLLRLGPGEAGPPRPQLITDFLGYNSFLTSDGGGFGHHPPPENWVGDLMLECEAAVEQSAGELRLEVAKGVDRFQARWDLASGTCTLVREREGKEETLGSAPAPLKQPGTHRLRLANVDERITVWVNDQLPFGDGVVYEPAPERGPTAGNDLRPAGIGARGAAVSARHLKLWRDTYYTLTPGSGSSDSGLSGDDWADPSRWEPLQHLPAKTFFVQPGHYFCLGDNSPESSDSRSWGVVPERLLEGRVLCRYYPLSRAGLVR
jgi:signal peptidase I